MTRIILAIALFSFFISVPLSAKDIFTADLGFGTNPAVAKNDSDFDFGVGFNLNLGILKDYKYEYGFHIGPQSFDLNIFSSDDNIGFYEVGGYFRYYPFGKRTAILRPYGTFAAGLLFEDRNFKSDEVNPPRDWNDSEINPFIGPGAGVSLYLIPYFGMYLELRTNLIIGNDYMTAYSPVIFGLKANFGW